jgi:sorbitol-specific phosphotransferase system component IIBC
MAAKKAICRKCNKIHKVKANEAVSRLVCYCGGRMRVYHEVHIPTVNEVANDKTRNDPLALLARNWLHL